MAIKRPERVLLHHVPLKFVRKRVTGGGRKSVDSSIPLVPFIDFLITLVVFLITSFSASGELLAQKPSIKMPEAEHTVSLEIAPVIAVDAEVVTLDGSRVADVASLQSTPEAERIELLIRNLETLKKNWELLHPSEPHPGIVVLQSDVKVDFRIIKKIMFSCAQAGYANLSFAVNKTGD